MMLLAVLLVGDWALSRGQPLGRQWEEGRRSVLDETGLEREVCLEPLDVWQSFGVTVEKQRELGLRPWIIRPIPEIQPIDCIPLDEAIAIEEARQPNLQSPATKQSAPRLFEESPKKIQSIPLSFGEEELSEESREEIPLALSEEFEKETGGEIFEDDEPVLEGPVSVAPPPPPQFADAQLVETAEEITVIETSTPVIETSTPVVESPTPVTESPTPVIETSTPHATTESSEPEELEEKAFVDYAEALADLPEVVSEAKLTGQEEADEQQPEEPSYYEPFFTPLITEAPLQSTQDQRTIDPDAPSTLPPTIAPTNTTVSPTTRIYTPHPLWRKFHNELIAKGDRASLLWAQLIRLEPEASIKAKGGLEAASQLALQASNA